MNGIYRGKGGALFSEKGTIGVLFENIRNEIKNKVTRYPIEKLLQVDESECVTYLIEKYSLRTPEIYESRATQKEPIEHYSNGILTDREFVFVVPYTGDTELFQYQAASPLPTIPAVLTEQFIELHFLIKGESEHDFKQLPKVYESALKHLNESLEWTRKVVDKFNADLESFVRPIIVRRKRAYEKTLAAAEATGVTIQRRQSLPAPYEALIAPKKKEIKPPLRRANGGKRWIITEKGYESILDIIRSMSMLMEKSPKTFAKLNEEEIRDHFLMLLNIYFEGQVTGETFNGGGKTDILIRVQDMNVFIAECKFWRGRKEFLKAIDQLFTYVMWRDAKTAILIFHKRGNFTRVKDKIQNEMLSHPYFVKERQLSDSALAENETVSSYILYHPEDKQQEVIVTSMSFNVIGPAKDKS
jgi:hypothetical protein